MANNFLTFAPTDTGTNLLTQGEYAIAPDRTNGNQPGVASSKLNNKAIRQSAFVVSQVAEYVSVQTGTDTLDDADTAKFLAQVTASFSPLAPTLTNYLSGSGTHNLTYGFFILTGSATVGATYTNNSVTFTVKATVASAKFVLMSGNGAPALSGTLTKASGTGDATLTFYARRAPVALEIIMVGGGGGGSGSGTATIGSGGNGGDTTFGTALLSAGGGLGGVGATAGTPSGGSGGSASLGTGPVGVVILGGKGQGAGLQTTLNSGQPAGGSGAASYFGGAGGGGAQGAAAGTGGSANSGAGGGGAGGGNVASFFAGSGGGAGGFITATIVSPTGSYAYSVGAAGAAGTAGASGGAGGPGGTGVIMLRERFQ